MAEGPRSVRLLSLLYLCKSAVHASSCMFSELESSVNNIAKLVNQLRYLEVDCHKPQVRLTEVLQNHLVECHDPQQRLIEDPKKCTSILIS